MKDPREPATYFKQGGPSPESIERLRGKLDDLLAALVAYKEKTEAPTPATKKIVDQEIDRLEDQRYRKTSRQFAKDAVDEMVHGSIDDAIDRLTEALEYKVFCRVEPHMEMSGADMEDHMFPIY